MKPTRQANAQAPSSARCSQRAVAALSSTSCGDPLTTRADDLVLLDSGLDSLCFAILVARLEQRLGVDPFSAAEDVYFPVTFGDFVRFYDEAKH